MCAFCRETAYVRKKQPVLDDLVYNANITALQETCLGNSDVVWMMAGFQFL
uniref:Uncharacterized protein n=1 Tax=Arion vulgaris TaxID=1028688 RepID=A0A0B7B2V0_9EUPU